MASAVGRFGAAGMGTEVVRVFSRALELINSSAGDSDSELLDMVKRAKREMDKEPFHLPKKARSSRVAAPAEAAELQSLGHNNNRSSASAAQAAMVGAAVAAEHTTSPPAGGSSWSDGGSGATSVTVSAAAAAAAGVGAGGGGSSSAAGGGSMTHAQARLMNVIRGGPGRGRIEKPKRKAAR